MKTSAFLRVLYLVVAAVVLGCWPQFAFAQRGGGGGGFHGGGGGGFHGGGGFAGGGFHGFGGGAFHGGGALNGSAGGRFGYPGGHSLGGYHGGGYHSGHGGSAWHNGHGEHHGWRGGYWGYGHRHYGWGWGYPWPYWGWGWGYPYGYYYYPWSYSPYPYDTPYCPPGYWCPPDQNDDPPPQNPARKSGITPVQPWRPAVRNSGTGYAGGNTVAHSGRVADPALEENATRRPEVLNAMRELREMPPFARQREIETGRYSQFSPTERELLSSFDAADLRSESQSDSEGFAHAVAHSW